MLMKCLELNHNTIKVTMVHKTKTKTLPELGLDSGTSRKSICISGI